MEATTQAPIVPEARGGALESLPFTTLRSVKRPHGLRKLTGTLIVVFITLPIALLLLPWQQNVQGSGRVIALNPLDRAQTIPAPVTGRLEKLHVQDGTFVSQGQVLAELADQDPQYATRLAQQIDLTRDKVQAARDMVDFYDQQLRFLEDAREQAISSARFELEVAVDEVRSAEQDLEAFEAAFQQKLADRDRKRNLLPEGVVSELSYQRAEADFLEAQAKVESGKAKVGQAQNKERAKRADVAKVSSDQQAKIESTKSSREDARAKVALYEKELTEATTKLERQKTQVVVAPRPGFVARVHAATSADLITKGDPLIEFVPDTQNLAVELWVRGVDASLVSPGRKVRLQFEGWPAVQFAGWPSVAVGTFGGEVSVVEALGNPDGFFRVLVVPDPNEPAWPARRVLRQGVRTNGWLLLDTVSVGFEIWRQLNAFPPSVSVPSDLMNDSSKPKKAKSKGGKEGKGE